MLRLAKNILLVLGFMQGMALHSIQAMTTENYEQNIQWYKNRTWAADFEKEPIFESIGIDQKWYVNRQVNNAGELDNLMWDLRYVILDEQLRYAAKRCILNLSFLNWYDAAFLKEVRRALRGLKAKVVLISWSNPALAQLVLEEVDISEVETLTVKGCFLKRLPARWQNAECLTKLDVSWNEGIALPEMGTKNLSYLNVTGCRLAEVPHWILQQSWLETFFAGWNPGLFNNDWLTDSYFPLLKKFDGKGCALVYIPWFIRNAERLEFLELSYNDQLVFDDASECRSNFLEMVGVTFCGLTVIPVWLRAKSMLQIVKISNNPIQSLGRWASRSVNIIQSKTYQYQGQDSSYQNTKIAPQFLYMQQDPVVMQVPPVFYSYDQLGRPILCYYSDSQLAQNFPNEFEFPCYSQSYPGNYQG